MTYRIKKLNSETDKIEQLPQLLDQLSRCVLKKGAVKVLLEKMRKGKSVLFVAVNQNDDIVGASTLLVEQKLIHNGGRVGHVEDVVVNLEHRGDGIAQSLMKEMVKEAKQQDCYKVILDCDVNLIGHYEKSGFQPVGVCMRLDL